LLSYDNLTFFSKCRPSAI